MKGTILVTGAAGFIGSHVAEKLLKNEEIQVVAIDNFDPLYSVAIKRRNIQSLVNHPRCQFIEMDILDTKQLDAVFEKFPIKAVIHLAAKAGVRPSLEDPMAYERSNVQATLQLLDVCAKKNVKSFVFASSSSIYGNSSPVPFREDAMVDSPISPYAATKKACELFCYTFHHLYKMNITCLRMFTVYGPRQRPDLAIHRFVKSIFTGQPITLFGDGGSSRDYTYVNDIVSGIMSALRFSINSVEPTYEVINLGSSRPIPLNELISTIEKVVGTKALVAFDKAQPGDVERTFADVSKAERLLNYRPSTDLADGIAAFFDWYKQCPEANK